MNIHKIIIYILVIYLGAVTIFSAIDFYLPDIFLIVTLATIIILVFKK